MGRRRVRLLRIVDSHAHLDQVEEVKSTLERAKAVGVVAVVGVGSGLESNRRILKIAESHRGYVSPALGLHPWNVSSGFEEDLAFIEARIGDVVALGEVGLDYWIKKDRRLQTEVLEHILRISLEHSKPVILHTRGAWEEAFEAVVRSGVEHAVFHWYSGSVKVLRRLLDSGYFISASPAAAYSRSHRAAVQRTPLERMLLETDCPIKYRGVESDPSTVLSTLRSVAELKGVDVEEVARITTENAEKFFHLKLST